MSKFKWAFQLALARSPSPAELKQVRTLFDSAKSKEEALVGLFRILTNSNEFIYVD